jgi:hypothetical protein
MDLIHVITTQKLVLEVLRLLRNSKRVEQGTYSNIRNVEICTVALWRFLSGVYSRPWYPEATVSDVLLCRFVANRSKIDPLN